MLSRGALVLALVAALAASAGAASPPGKNSGASARAYAVRIVLPNEAAPILQAEAVSPPDGTGFAQEFAYPADGSAVKTGALTSSAESSPGSNATAQAASATATLSLFNGEITADTVAGRARGSATPKAASGDLAGTGFTNLTVLGAVVPEPTPNQRLPLADWGFATLLEQPQAPPSSKSGYHSFVIALDLHLTAERVDDQDGRPRKDRRDEAGDDPPDPASLDGRVQAPAAHGRARLTTAPRCSG